MEAYGQCFGCPEVCYLVERTGKSAMPSVEGPYVRPTFFKQLAQYLDRQPERASSTPELSTWATAKIECDHFREYSQGDKG